MVDEIDRELRVLHILADLRPSGMERMLVSGASHFAQRRIVNIIVGQGSDNSYADEMRAAGNIVYTVPKGLVGRHRRYWLRTIVGDERVDLIHLHTEARYLPMLVAIKLACRQTPIVRTVHNVFRPTGAKFLQRYAQTLIADRLVKTVIAPSPDVAKNERRFGRRCIVIYNWVDDRFHLARKRRTTRSISSPPTALIVGNCSEVKNHELALQVLARTGCAVIHLGSEQACSSAESGILQSLQSDDRLIKRGVDDPYEWVGRADFYVMPSLNEGMPVALAEALTAGLPALVSRVPGLNWASHVKNVRVVDLSANAWYTAVDELSRKPLIVNTWNPTGPEIDFSASRGIAEYFDVYKRALGWA